MTGDAATDLLLSRSLREESGPLVGSLARRFGDFDLAEEAVQGAVVKALVSWRRDGPPDNPAAWLRVAATRQALDLVRSASRRRGLAERLPAPWSGRSDVQPSPADERLAMLFGCCHPALAPEARLALTLRAVIGMTTPQIARAFLVPEATLAQRIVRAKRKIVTSKITMRVPDPDELPDRLGDVLAVIYLMYNEGFVSSTGDAQDRDLAADAVWLADVVAVNLPDQAEAWGLAALLTAQHARADSRFSSDGSLVLLADQDRGRWDRLLVDRADDLLAQAAALRQPGRYQLQAAIALCHASAPSYAETDWLQIVALYDLLRTYDPSPVTALNRAVAIAELGPAHLGRALIEVERVAPVLDDYHLLHATRGALLTRIGRDQEATLANRRALELTANASERRLLQGRLGP